jgi:2-polyprenyl-3-methyl-5-hydroxy-6-metoxy-1,4-benzoquinol methylase
MASAAGNTLPEQEEAFAGKVLQAILGAQSVQTAAIGHKLGWYKALSEAGEEGMTPQQLADETQTSARYAREWLEQQTVTGWLGCLNPDESNRRYFLPQAHVSVLVDHMSMNYLLPLVSMQAAFGSKVSALADAYKNNTGFGWVDMGDDVRKNEAALNRPFYHHCLGSILEECLDPQIADKLKNEGGHIVDIGAGFGWSSIAMAKHFAAAQIDMYDLDPASVEAAKSNIAESDLESRVTAHCKDFATHVEQSPADLVVALECVHDMSDPISVLRNMLKLVGKEGTVIVMDSNVNERFSTEASIFEQLYYGSSCTCCLVSGKNAKTSAETGIMRPAVLKAYAQQAGFSTIEMMAVDQKPSLSKWVKPSQAKPSQIRSS